MKNTQNLNEKLLSIQKEKQEFYDEAFRDYTGSREAKNASIRICEAYGIKGICDPAYIANTIDKENELEVQRQLKKI